MTYLRRPPAMGTGQDEAFAAMGRIMRARMLVRGWMAALRSRRTGETPAQANPADAPA